MITNLYSIASIVARLNQPQPRSSRLWRYGLALILALFAITTFVQSLAIPLFEGSDEPRHYAYARYLVNHIALPPHLKMVTGLGFTYEIAQESGQPPLYYLPVALLTALVPNADPTSPFLVHNSFVAVYDEVGLPYDNHNSYLHTTEGDFPYQGVALGVHLGRLVSIMFGLLTLWSVYQLSLAMMPSRPAIALLAVALVASVPGFLFVHATITNDVAPILFVTLSLWVAARIMRDGPTPRLALAGGAYAALALLSKLNGAWVIGIVWLSIIASAWVHRRQWPFAMALGSFALSVLAWALLSGWWVAFTVAQHDVLGLAIHAAESEQNPLRLVFSSNLDILGDIAANLQSMWYYVGWGSISGPGWIYQTFDQLYFVGMIGAIGLSIQTVLRRRTTYTNAAIGTLQAICLALAILCAMLGGAYWLLVYGWRLGRLLYPGLTAAAVLVALGWGWLLSQLRRIGVAPLAFWGVAAVISVALLHTVIGSTQNTLAALYPHPYIAPVSADMAPTQVTFLDPEDGKTPVASIVGYHLNLQDVRAGGIVVASICWKSLGYTRQSFPYSMQLVGPNDVRPGTRNSYHGLGSYPMTAWPADREFCDPSSLRVTLAVDRPRAYKLMVTLFQLDPLSFKVGPPLAAVDGAGRPVYPALARVRVAPDHMPLVTPTVSLGDVAGLVSAHTELQPNNVLSVTLRWVALKSTSVDGKVFMHVLDQAGQVIAQSDHEPDDGWFPTNYWQHGDVIDDQFQIPLPPGTDPDKIALRTGLYDAQSQARFTAVDLATKQRIPDDAIPIVR